MRSSTTQSTLAEADQAFAQAQLKLGLMYLNGVNTPKDKERATFFFLQAANQGVAEAQYWMGWIAVNWLYHFNEDFTQAHFKQAVKFYQLAADQGHAKARYNLGLLYEYAMTGWVYDDHLKRHVPPRPNIEMAFYCFSLAAKQGHADAQSHLARMNALGLGVAQDKHEAARLYRLSIEQGSFEAKEGLRDLYDSTSGFSFFDRHPHDKQIALYHAAIIFKEAKMLLKLEKFAETDPLYFIRLLEENLQDAALIKSLLPTNTLKKITQKIPPCSSLQPILSTAVNLQDSIKKESPAHPQFYDFFLPKSTKTHSSSESKMLNMKK